ncbi:MAG: hypothetical protein V4660_19375 [Pseudomonadota bacterium]
MYRFWYLIAAITIFCKLCATANANPESAALLPANTSAAHMTVSYNKVKTQSSLTDVYAYRDELIYQLFEVTRPEYGDYRIRFYETELTSMRQAQFLGEGKVLNLAWGSPGTAIAKANAIPISIDILKGLLGYRICLINKNAQLTFINLIT